MRRLTPLRRQVETLVESMRLGLTRATLSLFAHAPYPLEHTLDYLGDPGLLGPRCESWRLLADPAAIVGGLRGLLIQSAHPEVVAGVDHHSRYRDDPFGRLSRTSAYVTATTFGSIPEVEQAVSQVNRIHRVVTGVSGRGVPYDASDPALSAWVHNVLTDSFLATNQVYAERALGERESDVFVKEQTRIGALLGSAPMPETAQTLADWVVDHPGVAPSAEMGDIVDFLTHPPLPAGIKLGYTVILEAAVATIPRRLQGILGLNAKPGAELAGRAAVAALRWALGFSPTWALALERNGAEIPWEMFKQVSGTSRRASRQGSISPHDADGGEGGI